MPNEHDAELERFIEGGNQFYEEIKQLILRYSKEADTTTFQMIGALETAKIELVMHLEE